VVFTFNIVVVRFLFGILLFALGFAVNVDSDRRLRNLRKSNEPAREKYKIPRGGAFELVSAANYAGEILEWLTMRFMIGIGFVMCENSGLAGCWQLGIGPRPSLPASHWSSWARERFNIINSTKKNLANVIPRIEKHSFLFYFDHSNKLMCEAYFFVHNKAICLLHCR